MDEQFIKFLVKAASSGLDYKTTVELYKQANDPGLQAGGQAPNPADVVPGGAPPMAGDATLPPELEQMIDSLPPEVLAQLVQQIEAELQQGGAQGGPMPGAPSPEKQGSVDDRLIAKEAEYIDGFLTRAAEYGFDKNAAEQIYYQALRVMDPTVPQVEKIAQDLHFQGFLEKAASYGLDYEQSVAAYNQYFTK